MKGSLFLFFPLLSTLAFTGAMAQCGAATITEAQESYNMGRLQECITGLGNCLGEKKGLGFAEKTDAYRLLAMAYLALDSIAMADVTIGNLLQLKDNFETDTRDPARFRLRVLFMRQQLRANLISSVSKKAERIDLAPATIQIITAEDIVQRGYQDLECVFSDLPGFDISRTNGLSYSTLYQRGYRSSALTDRTLLLVDGVEDNELWTNAAYLSKQYPVSSIKRVEVIYGPASTIYGANAFQGVINIVTKSEEDFFFNNSELNRVKTSGIAMNFYAGAGSYKTKYYDGTLAMKGENLFFSVTGRLYKSDEFDLSPYSNWDGKVQFNKDIYKTLLTDNSLSVVSAAIKDPAGYYHTVASNKVVPTLAAIDLAQSLDRQVYTNNSNDEARRYNNATNDVYLSSKLNIGDMKLQFQYWNIKEGTASDYLDSYTAINQLTSWQVKQYFISARYNKILFNKIYVSWFSYFKSSQFGPDASTTRFLSYANHDLSFKDLLDGKVPSFRSTYYSEQSNQFRTELTGNYTINQYLDVIGGAEFRNGILQGDYLKGTQYPAVISGVTTDTLAGGNNYSPVTFGVYTQLNYQNKRRRLNINAGGRVEHNTYRQNQGYGSVLNPRLAVIYYPGKFVFKSIYSEAFLDASSFNKFSTSATRQLNNPALKPEKVKNVEVSALYTFGKSHIEIAAYSAWYNSILQTASVLTNGTSTTQFQALNKVRIQGIQLSLQTFLNKNINLYANFSTTDPRVIVKNGNENKYERIGDISRYTLNAGLNITLLKNRLNVNLRTNIVGDKPTGKNTSVSTNPLDEIAGYNLFNTAITWKIKEPVRLQFVVNNLFNQAYASPGIRAADNIQYAASVPQPPRNYFLKIIINFSR